MLFRSDTDDPGYFVIKLALLLAALLVAIEGVADLLRLRRAARGDRPRPAERGESRP